MNTQQDTMVPADLVYEGAIRRNEEGGVNIRSVDYNLHGIGIAANVYTPAGYGEEDSFPAVVVAHPNGGVKEQVAGLYAQRLAEAGYVTIAADAAFQGASGASPETWTGLPCAQRTYAAWWTLRVRTPESIRSALARLASVAVAATPWRLQRQTSGYAQWRP